MRVAIRARQAGIVQRGRPVMLSCSDVVDLVRQDRVFLRKTAVFTFPLGAVANRLSAEFSHALRCGTGFAHHHFRLGVQQVEELPDPEVLLQSNAFFGRDGSTIVFLEKLLNLLDGLRLKFETEQGPSRIRM